ncbi:ATP-binding cassette domain-containing protein [Galbitalea sp. SE-J8]|uniref:ABC transporter ATP-binding protein n=1 Tax=Galbitalea sp. SE-J8 TaxID=3054952 RepID=UPI00259C7BEB|nr:ATP-binding cassette domain-containing protein [Galbitalea sp. SE-J8]MDM4763216.1 ATP-binding cassette domain-containing protein [Galbitalea sp. SE-J8]
MSQNAPTALLAFQGIIARYDGNDLFPPLTFTVHAGEIVALKGRSGSGKSTALRIAMGMRAPSSGSVSWKGTDLYTMTDDDRTRLRASNYGVVLQDGGMIRGISATANVVLPVLRRRPTRAEADRARDTLRLVGLDRHLDRLVDGLSGGEAQRVAFARALFAEPELLLVDEPTASLDRHNAASVVALLAATASRDRGVLVATHDQEVLDAAHTVVDLDTLA